MQRFIDKVWVDDARVYAKTRDGLVASYPFAMWERLDNASKVQLKDY